jgi:hypothetical protein
MSDTLLEKHKDLVNEMAHQYLGNMELELGKKYKDNKYEINASLSETQYTALKEKYGIADLEFADLYSEFQKMEPTQHLKQAMDAFTASGGGVDIEPSYDEESQRLNVAMHFVIKENTLDRIEGLSPMEDFILRMNAMLQIDNVLSGSDPDIAPTF